jgi:hypothetical protein
MLKVIITKKHCIGAVYMSNTDCPLARAIKEQHKIKNISVGGDDVSVWTESPYKGEKVQYFVFNAPDMRNGLSGDAWGLEIMNAILEDRLGSVTIHLHPEIY